MKRALILSSFLISFGFSVFGQTIVSTVTKDTITYWDFPKNTTVNEKYKFTRTITAQKSNVGFSVKITYSTKVVKSGFYEQYAQNKNILTKGEYTNDQITGEWSYYNQLISNQLSAKEIYSSPNVKSQSITYQYDKNGKLLSTVQTFFGPNSVLRSEYRDADSKLTKIEYPQQNGELMTDFYNANGKISKTEYTLVKLTSVKLLRTVTYYYDGNLKLTKKGYSDVNPNVVNNLTKNEYFDANEKLSKAEYYDTNGKNTKTEYYSGNFFSKIEYYDSYGNYIIKRENYDNNGIKATTENYNTNSKLVKKEYFDGNGAYTKVEYLNESGSLTRSEVYTNGNMEAKNYDNNKLTKIESYVNAKLKMADFYDANNNRFKTEEYFDNGKISRISSYDAKSNYASTYRVESFNEDGTKNKITTFDPNSNYSMNREEVYSSNIIFAVTIWDYRNKKINKETYNNAGKLIQVDYFNFNNTTSPYKTDYYDGNGNITSTKTY